MVHRLRLPLALLLLGIGAWPSMRLVVDDLYISYTYALRLLAGDGLTWSTGERVEGYSNLSWTLLLAVGRGADLPVTWFAKGCSFLAAALLLGAVHRRAPPTWMGTWLLLVLAGWGALGTWSALGMETTLFALLLWAGWGPATAGGAPSGQAALLLAALTRPEGSLYVLGAALLRRDRASFVAVAALGGYHLARWSWFGAWLPNTVLAKAHSGDQPWAGLEQAATEGLVALPLGVALLATWRVTRRLGVLALAPVLLHVGMLVRMRGDWMGDTRILLPGIVAGISVFAHAGVPRPRAPWLLLGVTTLLAFTPLHDGALSLRFREPVPTRLWLPLLEDVEFLVHRVPAGRRFETGDMGVPGLVPDLRGVDRAGLTDRAWALAGAGGSAEVDARYTGDDALACVRRYAQDPEIATPRFQALMAEYRQERTVRGVDRRHVWWCRDGLPWADAATVRERWLALVDRLPEHAALRWHAARMLADAGQLQAAEALYSVDPAFGEAATALVLTVGAVPETRTARGFVLADGVPMRSRPLGAEERLVVRSAGPVTLTYVDATMAPVSSRSVAREAPVELPEGASRFTLTGDQPRVEVWIEAR